MNLATIPLDLSPVSTTIKDGLLDGAAAGIAILLAIWGLKAILNAFKAATGTDYSYGDDGPSHFDLRGSDGLTGDAIDYPINPDGGVDTGFDYGPLTREQDYMESAGYGAPGDYERDRAENNEAYRQQEREMKLWGGDGYDL